MIEEKRGINMKKKEDFSILSNLDLLRAYVFTSKNVGIVKELKRRHLISDAKKLRRVTSVFVQKEAQQMLQDKTIFSEVQRA